ncbi:protein-tyrosine phosphatase family protein [Nocardia arthritidis]|uniref:Protein phosphatase n=1 Tax=Nocardia arthritidis TaxID=228602 RepID=A0A6G9Y7K6_9NOCA|nr:dual specificity protein phosphatase family protein [Nocardia arthritidis]QIS09158.1 protein phosphatase [Nocardia arthritidis]
MVTRIGPAPMADEPWNEIVGGLSMGGHWVRGGVPVVVRAEFDVVVSLFQREGHGPGTDVEHHYLNIPDRPLLPEQLDEVFRLAELTAGAVDSGRRVLVRCEYGYNRSGLVVAGALGRLGYPVADAIELVRRRRSEWALHNQAFVEYLTNGHPGPHSA